MRIIPISLKTANAFVEEHHRHNKKVISHKFSIGLEKDGKLIGVAISSRPTARMLDDGQTLEIKRCCVLPGHPNACSKLLARSKRVGQFMGYTRVVTYTLECESGSSLRAIGAKRVAKVRPQTWTRRNPHRPQQPAYDQWKYRWVLQESCRSEGKAA